MQNLYGIIGTWESKGKPAGARFYDTSEGLATSVKEIESLFPLNQELLFGRKTYLYLDPLEAWIKCESYEVSVKLKYGKLRARKKTHSIDDAWNEWHGIDEILLKDIYDYEFEYLSSTK